MKIIYHPEKGFFNGIPARDLSKDEWEGLSDEMQKTLIKLGLYEIVYDKKIKKESE